MELFPDHGKTDVIYILLIILSIRNASLTATAWFLAVSYDHIPQDMGGVLALKGQAFE